ncbi:MAG: transcriptional regulator, partial [Rhodospirillales bacterium]|nr:transcriptional regulator [Rhodospirillales bacterium]
SELGVKVVRPMWIRLQEGVMAELDTISIDDLCDNAADSKIVSEGRKNLDFSI